jgi:hypothetical protein
MKKSKILKWASVPISLGAFVAFVWLENRRPLRRAVESKTIRSGRNLAVAGLAGAALQLFENPVVTPLTKFVERKNFGLLNRIQYLQNLSVKLSKILE